MLGLLSELGAKWRTLFLSASSSLSNLNWRVSLSSDAWPYLEDEPAQSSLQTLCVWLSRYVSLTPTSHLIIRCCVKTNQPFLPVTLRTLIYFTSGTIQWHVSLKLIPGSSFCHIHAVQPCLCWFYSFHPCEVVASNSWGKENPQLVPKQGPLES